MLVRDVPRCSKEKVDGKRNCRNRCLCIAMVLPGLFEKAAQIVEKPARAVINAATYTNNELGEYVAGMARKLAETETVKQEYQNFLEA